EVVHVQSLDATRRDGTFQLVERDLRLRGGKGVEQGQGTLAVEGTFGQRKCIRREYERLLGPWERHDVEIDARPLAMRLQQSFGPVAHGSHHGAPLGDLEYARVPVDIVDIGVEVAG